MAASHGILICGRDVTLLNTRCWVLERAGFKVRTTRDIGEVRRLAVESSVDLILLCHTLSPAEREKAMQSAAEAARIKKLLFFAHAGPGHEDAAGHVVDPFDGPKGLIHAVQQALTLDS
jgi:hypothetical protein